MTKEMSNEETAAWMNKWCEDYLSGKRGLFSWPTDGCGYNQHIRFVQYRNDNWQGGTREQFVEFVRKYADSISVEELKK